MTPTPHRQATELAGSARGGTLVTSREVVATAEAKAALFASSGAVAVDMESAVILAHAAAAGCPTLVVRGVSDAANESVPLELIDLMTPDGKLRPVRALALTVTRPRAAAARPGPAPGHPARPHRGRAGARGARRRLPAVNVLVTGGTGFVGANLVRELLADGHTVRVLARPGRRPARARGLRGGHRRGRSAGRALAPRRGGRAPVTSTTWPPTTGSGRRTSQVLYRANVDGTRHLLAAAAEAGAERIVYTSTVGALGIPKDGTPGRRDDAGVARPTWSAPTRRPSSWPSAWPTNGRRAGRRWSSSTRRRRSARGTSSPRRPGR